MNSQEMSSRELSISYGWRNESHDDINVNAIASFSIVAALLSSLGAGSVLMCSIYHKRVLCPEVFPTFHLAVADLLASVIMIMSSVKFLSDQPGSGGPDLTCATFSGLLTSFYTSAFLLTLVYAVEVLLRFRKRLKNGMSLESLAVSAVSHRFIYVAYIFAWLAPLILALVVIIRSYTEIVHQTKKRACSMCFADFRFDSQHCWVTESGDMLSSLHLMAKLAFLVPLVSVMIINVILYACIWITYRQVVFRTGLLSYHQRQEEKILRRKTGMYYAVFLVCWLPTIIIGYASFGPEYSMFRFYPGLVIQVILGPLQGLFNSIVYGWKRDSFRRALTERSSLLGTDRSTLMSVTL